jgi:Arc/MetJ family transcription regulator
MGRTNIVLDDRLIREGLRRFKCRSKRELRGQVKWEGDLAELRRLRP